MLLRSSSVKSVDTAAMDSPAVVVLVTAAVILSAHGLDTQLDSASSNSDLTLTLHRKLHVSGSRAGPCGSLTCQAQGEHVTVHSVTVATPGGATGRHTELLAVGANSSQTEIRTDKIYGNGTLHKNGAKIYLHLKEESSCESGYFVCEVTYTEQSGEKKTAFTVTGPGQFTNLQTSSETKKQGLTRDEGSSSPSYTYTHSDPYKSELWFLGDKINKIEGKFATLSDRLESRLGQNIDAVQKRASGLENSVLERVSSAETGFSGRLSQLEARVSSLLLSDAPDSPDSPDAGPATRQSLADLERRVDEVSSSLEGLNVSQVVPQPGTYQQPNPETCDRGMGDDVTKTYRPYVIMHHQEIGRDILCDTHTVGGGWIVIQRRAKGDVDFYRDWTAYREGFGSPTGDFWLGNRAIHQLTDSHPYELRIDIRVKGQEMFSQYSTFRLEAESDKYRLRLGAHSGTAAHAAMSYHNNQPFSTFDRDNDGNAGSCANTNHGAWWYNNCHHSNLNGMWGVLADRGLRWYTGSVSLHAAFSEMKVRRVKRSS